MREEIWKIIPNHQQYEVSDLGKVRRGQKVLKPRNHNQGYQFVFLNGRERYCHRLVAGAFIGSIPPRWEVNHLDGNPANNALENLEIVTPKQNRQHFHQPIWYRTQTTISEFENICPPELTGSKYRLCSRIPEVTGVCDEQKSKVVL